jgi:protein gp37
LSEKTGIEWTEATWSPITGCERISPGCAHCYAERQTATRLAHQPKYQGLAVITPGGEPHWTGWKQGLRPIAVGQRGQSRRRGLTPTRKRW